MWSQQNGLAFRSCSQKRTIDQIAAFRPVCEKKGGIEVFGLGFFERVAVFVLPEDTDTTAVTPAYALGCPVPHKTAAFVLDEREGLALFLGVNLSGMSAACAREFVVPVRRLPAPLTCDLSDVEEVLRGVQRARDGELRPLDFKRGLLLLTAAFVALGKDTAPLLRYALVCAWDSQRHREEGKLWGLWLGRTAKRFSQELQSVSLETLIPCALSQIVVRNAVCRILTVSD